MKRFLIFLAALALGWLWPSALFAKTIWVTQSGAGSTDGSSLANAFSAAKFNSGTNWGAGAGKISPADTVQLSGTFTSLLTAQASGTSSSARTIFTGDGVFSSPWNESTTFTGTTVLVGFNMGATLSHLALLNCQIGPTTISNIYAAVTFSASTDCLVEDNYIFDNYGGGIQGGSTNSNTNIVRHNLLASVGLASLGLNSAGGDTLFAFYGNSPLIEYNIVLKGLDRVRPYGQKWVVRNNIWGATDTAYYTSSTPYPFHTDGNQGLDGSPDTGFAQMLYEKNYDHDNLDTADTPTAQNGHAIILQFTSTARYWYIHRFNQLIRVAEADSIFHNLNQIYRYNNTNIQVGYGITNHSADAVYFETTTADDTLFINDTWTFCPQITSGNGVFTTTAGASFPTNSTFDYLHSFSAAGAPSQPGLPLLPGTHNLSHTDPLFVDGTGVAGHDNYQLQSGSPLRNTARYVTTANGSGTGSTTLNVATGTGKRLFDGWSGITPDGGDWIKIGSGAYVQIISISTDAVTLGAARTWNGGDAVLVKGQEDVGALPFPYVANSNVPTITATTATASPTALTGTTTTADGVRMVEFKYNGIPVGIAATDFSGSFSFTYTPSGAGTLETRAYNYWSSATPSVSAFQLINQDPSGLATGALTGSTIAISWTDNSGGLATYSIETSLDNSSFTVFGTTAAGASSGSVTGLLSGTKYYIRIRAVLNSIYSGYSSTVNATTTGSGGGASYGMGGKAVMGGKCASYTSP